MAFVASEPVVAVCTNRSPAAVADSLAALRAQVPAEQVVLVTSGLSPAAVEAHRAAADGVQVVGEPLSGLSVARNRALELARAAGAPAIAYVDDDALVDAGWWDALRARWAAGDGQLGCVGGPIRPAWAVPPPDWLSAPILPALTLLDLGDSERWLDPRVTTVFGANISFAVEPLHAAGGFDPAYGHAGTRVFFAEEDQAQRALAARGYRVLYAPELGVQHVIPAERLARGAFIRRRYAYGKSLGMRDGRGAARALRQVATSGPGALVALARRDDKRFMERAVRVAENAGVLAGRARRG